MNIRWSCLTGLMLATMIGQVEGAAVVGGSGFMTQAYADKVEYWLGEGSITLTNVFTKTGASTSYDFHSAADGKGRTITVIEVLGDSSHTIETQVIGGYNPLSWHLSGYSTAATQRDAFIFNLTSLEKQNQNTNGHIWYQTYNAAGYGPTFGYGHDIYVDSNLSSGYAYNYSYGGQSYGDNILTGVSVMNYGLSIGRIEVYTIAAAQGVPEPASIAMWGIGALGLVFVRRKRQQMKLAV